MRNYRQVASNKSYLSGLGSGKTQGNNSLMNWLSNSQFGSPSYQSVTYGNGRWVAVSNTFSSNFGMMALDQPNPNLLNWQQSNPVFPATNTWNAVCFGQGKFVAVAGGASGAGADYRVMTSIDGLEWTGQIISGVYGFQSICYSNDLDLFVAVANSGSGSRIWTSHDTINWTLATATISLTYNEICYGNGLFVAVAFTGGACCMTSPDGITWTPRIGLSTSRSWRSVCYGNGLFVAVASGDDTTIGDTVATSKDGITWTFRSTPAKLDWASITFGDGIFVAVSQNRGDQNKVMFSSDGISWTTSRTTANHLWSCVAYASKKFVIVASGATPTGGVTASVNISFRE
jgi:hypothetical protein